MKTAMQDLREDLILTQTSAEESLLEIENQEVRKACQEVVRLTLNNIIKRIDDELLEMEKQQKGYSEEEVLDLFVGILDANKCFVTFKDIKEWFEQFKNK